MLNCLDSKEGWQEMKKLKVEYVAPSSVRNLIRCALTWRVIFSCQFSVS